MFILPGTLKLPCQKKKPVYLVNLRKKSEFV
ncbi:MAG: hypothetical protein JWP12_3535 [Bacteroidetes bacterium]|nr:hypothetical protein [Bacteroidota bacterium]